MLADYAAFADCVILSEPGGGLAALESLHGSPVPTVLYDRNTDPFVAERATRLGVTEYVAGTDALRLHDRTAAVVGIETEQATDGKATTLGRQTPALKMLSETKETLRSAETVEEVAETAVGAVNRATGIDIVGIRIFSDEEVIAIATAAFDEFPANAVDVTFDEERIESALQRGEILRGDGGVFSQPSSATIPIGGQGILFVESETGPIGGPDRRLLSALATDVESALCRLDRRSEIHRHENIHQLTEQFTIIVDEDGRIEFLTQALIERFGYDAESLIGSSSSELFDGDGLWQYYDPATASPDDPVAVETTIQTDGGMYPVSIELFSRQSPTGSDELLGVVSERTERAALGTDSERGNRFRHLFDHLPDAIVDLEFIDGAPRVRRVNDAFEETFGYEEADIRDSSLHDLIIPDGSESLDETSIQQGHDTAEVERLTADGRQTFLFRGFSYQDGESKRGFGIYTDIDDRLEQERRLRVLHRVLRHNLRNEMTAIAGYADILAGTVSNQESREYAENIYEQATDVSKLGEQVRRIEQALDVDRSLVALDPESLVGEIAEWFRSNRSETTIQISVDGDEEILADELLKIAIENLVENAIEHHPDAATVEIRLEVVDDTWFDIAIRDDGPGIPERERAVVGGDREITQLDHSMGLGLWVTRWIVQGVDGRLLFGDCESGSEVTLRLRRADSNDSE